MAYTNLLVKIESEINITSAQMAMAPQEEKPRLADKKEKLSKLAHDYVSLENQYKELAGLNKVY